MIGQVVGKRYQIEAELGAGGMGTVYRALDTQSKAIVAVKQLKADFANAELIERFKREGEALRDLNHPNIVKMLDAVEEDGKHYLIMDYVSGGDLAALLKEGQLPLDRILNIAIDLADALTRAHRLTIIHRDLKPANVLIADNGTLRLTDFGVAHVGSKERVTDTDAIVGTVDYLAPESLDGDEIDPRADIWAFGVMLFEMLAGERPFKGETVHQTLMAIMTHAVPDLEKKRTDAPIALIDLVYRMLEKSRNARIRSVRYVGAELEDILHGRTTQTPPETRFAPDTPNFLKRPKHNLPAQTTPFVGREHELGEVAKLIANPNIRLLTILAPGGMGKTRLTLEAAEQHVSRFDDGVYFVEFAPLSDPANIVSAIADATGYQFQGDGRDQKQQVLDFLKNKNMLLVLDNFEHLLDGAGLVTDILQAAADVNILATSRQRLSQSGEMLFHLSGMDFPDWETPEDALEYAAVKLFMNSAQRAQPAFELTDNNLDYVARICRLVQGMPLGIVLAASWLAILTPQEIADEIQHSIDFLTDELGEAPDRQRSIRTVFEYSWEQMTEAEQGVFMKLSVFRGGFTREAAQEVAGANLRLLMSLTNKSLIRRDVDGGRYEVHELLRQYAKSKLRAKPDMSKSAHENFCTYFVDILEQSLYGLRSKSQLKVLQNIDVEIENIRSVWYLLAEQMKFREIKQIIHSLWLYLYIRGLYEVGVELFSRGIHALEGISTTYDQKIVISQMRAAQSLFYAHLGFFEESQMLGEAALKDAQQFGKDEDGVLALIALSQNAAHIGNVESCRRYSRELLQIADATGELWYRTGPLVFLTLFDTYSGQHTEAKAHLEALFEVFETYDDLFFTSVGLRASGLLALAQGKYAEAQETLQKCVDMFQKLGQHYMLALTYQSLSQIMTKLKAYTEARRYYVYRLQLYKTTGSDWEVISAIAGDITDYFKIQQDYKRVIELLSFVHHHPSSLEKTQDHIMSQLEQLKSSLDSNIYNAAFERGKSLDLETVVKELLDEFGTEA